MPRSLLLLSVLTLGACEALPVDQWIGAGTRITEERSAEAIREALAQGSERASRELSERGAYADDPALRIHLPEQLQGVAAALRQSGLGRHVDQLETMMNRGAEEAAAQAGAIFIEAVRDMTIDEAIAIVRGPEDAATQYFRRRTEDRLRARYRPVIRENLQQLGFYDQYRLMVNLYSALPLRDAPELDLEAHVLGLALDGLFDRISDEEQLIREDPAGRGSAVIASVFGASSTAGQSDRAPADAP